MAGVACIFFLLAISVDVRHRPVSSALSVKKFFHTGRKVLPYRPESCSMQVGKLLRVRGKDVHRADESLFQALEQTFPSLEHLFQALERTFAVWKQGRAAKAFMGIGCIDRKGSPYRPEIFLKKQRMVRNACFYVVQHILVYS